MRLAHGIILILPITAEAYKICKRAQRLTEDTTLALPIIAKPLVIRASKDLEAKKKVDLRTAKPTRIGPFVPCHLCFHFHREQRDPLGVQSPHHSLHVPQVGNLSLLRK